MKSFEKLLLGGLVTTTVISSNFLISNGAELINSQCSLTNNLNMRKGPSTDYISVGLLKKGTIVTPLEYSKNKLWVKINHNNQDVWISAKYIKVVENNNDDKLENYKTTENVNLRSGPSTDNTVLLTIQKGSNIKVGDISNDGKWAHVSYNNKIGWVNISYIEKVTDNNNENQDNATYENYITTSAVNVRKGPSTLYDKLGYLKEGTVIKPIGFDKYEDWVKFKFNGEEGWVSKYYLKKSSEINNTNDNTKYEKYTSLSNLNLRKGPSTSYDKITQIPKGATVDFIKFSADKKWANVKYNSTTGWVSYQYIKKLSNSTNDTDTTKIMYTSENVNLRSTSSTNGKRLCTIPKDSKVSVISYNNEKTWAKVKYNNETGWVSAQYLKSEISNYKTGTTTCRLKLRKSPNTTGDVIMIMPIDAKVKIYEESDGWLKVSYNNVTGYCSSSYVK